AAARRPWAAGPMRWRPRPTRRRTRTIRIRIAWPILLGLADRGAGCPVVLDSLPHPFGNRRPTGPPDCLAAPALRILRPAHPLQPLRAEQTTATARGKMNRVCRRFRPPRELADGRRP